MTETVCVSKRHHSIDLLKGICIILVVFGHTLPDAVAFTSISRMPLYFFLSGLFFSRYNSFETFLLKKINNLLVPLLFFAVLSIFYQFIAGSIKGNFDHIFSLDAWSEKLLINTPLWFLISLFEVSVLYYATNLIANRIVKTGIVIAISMLGYRLGVSGIDLPFYIDSSMTALIFYHIGSMAKNGIPNIFQKSNYDLVVLALSFGLFIYLLKHVSFINLHLNHFSSPYILTVIQAMTGIVFLFVICKRIDKIALINKFGRYSIVILGLHMPLLGIYRFYFKDSEAMEYIFIITTFIICNYLIDLLVKIAPQFIAQKELFIKHGGKIYLNTTSNLSAQKTTLLPRNPVVNYRFITYTISLIYQLSRLTK